MVGCVFHFRTHGTGGTYMWRGKHKITGWTYYHEHKFMTTRCKMLALYEKVFK